MSLPKLTSLPPNPSEELVKARELAQEARKRVRKMEEALRLLRKDAEQHSIRYENLVLEHLGQLRLDLEDPHGRTAEGRTAEDDAVQR